MLAERGVEFQRRDYFKEPFSPDELTALLDEIGMTPSEALSTRSKAYRDLGLANRNLSDAELVSLIVENPTLLRRPIVVADSQAVIGFKQEQIESMIEQ